MKILHIVGARPNFMKVAPVMRAISNSKKKFSQFLVHTGQHYDDNMSRIFFDELQLPKPDINLEVGPGSHAQQTAYMMIRLEKTIQDFCPDWVCVYGDVNSTLAGALVASKLNIRLAHVEAGLRSFDKTMPEECNRIVTDRLADLLFTPSRDANENLADEGVHRSKIHSVGNVMIDTLLFLRSKSVSNWKMLKRKYNLDQYVLVTLHRPSNVDDLDSLAKVMDILFSLSKQIKIVFPIHPRTLSKFNKLKIKKNAYKNILFLKPLGYLDFLGLESNASLVLTDSGGVQEETTFLKIPCLTLRNNTERPVTTELGTNQLVSVKGDHRRNILPLNKTIHEFVSNDMKKVFSKKKRPRYWDGKAGYRIAQVFEKIK